METTEMLLPSFLSSYLMYGDDAGISKEERFRIEYMIAINKLGGCLDVKEDTHFSEWNDQKDLFPFVFEKR